MDVGHRADPGFCKNIARRFRDVFGRVVQAEPGRQLALATFGKNFAMVIGMKLVDHDPVHA